MKESFQKLNQNQTNFLFSNKEINDILKKIDTKTKKSIDLAFTEN